MVAKLFLSLNLLKFVEPLACLVLPFECLIHLSTIVLCPKVNFWPLAQMCATQHLPHLR